MYTLLIFERVLFGLVRQAWNQLLVIYDFRFLRRKISIIFNDHWFFFPYLELFELHTGYKWTRVASIFFLIENCRISFYHK